MLPAPQEKSRLEKVKRFFGWSSDSSPNHDDMQKKCLEIYLSAPRKLICDCELSSAQFNIAQAANVMRRVFLQLYCQKIHHYQTKDWISDQLPKVSKSGCNCMEFRLSTFFQVMVGWLLSLVDELQMKSVNNAEENGRRMASVLAIVDCIHSLVPNPISRTNFELRAIAAVLSMLRLQPNLKDRQHSDLDIVLNLLPEKSKKTTSEALCGLCTHLSSRKDLQEPVWVHVIPLIHFLQKKTKPFNALNPDRIVWENLHLGLKQVKSVTRDKDKRLYPLLAMMLYTWCI